MEANQSPAECCSMFPEHPVPTPPSHTSSPGLRASEDIPEGLCGEALGWVAGTEPGGALSSPHLRV